MKAYKHFIKKKPHVSGMKDLGYFLIQRRLIIKTRVFSWSVNNVLKSKFSYLFQKTYYYTCVCFFIYSRGNSNKTVIDFDVLNLQRPRKSVFLSINDCSHKKNDESQTFEQFIQFPSLWIYVSPHKKAYYGKKINSPFNKW